MYQAEVGPPLAGNCLIPGLPRHRGWPRELGLNLTRLLLEAFRALVELAGPSLEGLGPRAGRELVRPRRFLAGCEGSFAQFHGLQMLAVHD